MKRIWIYTVLILFLSSCTTERDAEYELEAVNVTQSGGEKNNQKSTTEFISIAYTDLFGAQIPQSRLVNLSVAYSSFGDLKVIEDRIIRNFLADTSANIPAVPSVNGDTLLFISDSYKKFFNRNPTEFEKYQWQQLIRNEAGINPVTIYYSLMTSDEYRFY